MKRKSSNQTDFLYLMVCKLCVLNPESATFFDIEKVELIAQFIDIKC